MRAGSEGTGRERIAAPSGSHWGPETGTRRELLVLVAVPAGREARRLISRLSSEGFTVVEATCGAEALQLARAHRPQAVVADRMVPGLDGIDLCRLLRSDRETAGCGQILLDDRHDAAAVVAALEAGIDEVVARTENPAVVAATVRAVMRRTGTPGIPGHETYRVGPLRIDVGRYLAQLEEQPLRLTVSEFRIVVALARSNGRVLTRQELLDGIRAGRRPVKPRAIDTHMCELRAKLGPHAGLIHSIRGVGYRLAVEG